MIQQDKDLDANAIAYCDRTEVTVTEKTLRVKYTYTDKALAAGNRGSRVKEDDDYFNEECGFVNLASIGIEKAVCEVDAKE